MVRVFKKTVMALLVGSLLPVAAVNAELHRGFKLGLNMSSMRGEFFDMLEDMGVDKTMNIGAMIGGVFKVDVTDVVKVQPEIYFSMKGVGMKFGDDKYSVALGYAEIPILLRADIPVNNKVTPFVLAGPAIGFRCYAFEIEDGDMEPYFDETNLVDFGLVFGGGADFAAGNNTVGFEVRYDLGLLNVDSENDSDFTLKNGVLSLIFNLGH